MHSRNLHKENYPLNKLCIAIPSLKQFVVLKHNGEQTIDFAQPEAVKTLNAALLKYYYQVEFWDLPANYLCPPVPGRADYVHHIADLLGAQNKGEIPTGRHVKGLDIGTGANLIYPIIASTQYGWTMLGSDIDPVSIASAKAILKANPRIAKHVKVTLQAQSHLIFDGVVDAQDQFDFCMCNPPFHTSAKAAQQSASRKKENLARNKQRRQSSVKGNNNNQLNFGGQANELWCAGGELTFIGNIITQSIQFSQQIKWFTSLVSKSENLPILLKQLNKVGAKDIKTVNMVQGNKTSRFLAWRF